jgi:hypothetical protein
MKKLSLIAALLLAGCSGGGGTDMPPGEPTPIPPAPRIDAFFAAVSGVVTAAPDDSEAASIDALAATAPEDNEPSSL